MSAASLVSVVMATLDAEPYLGAALDSVAAQTYSELEVVLVDGGSTDGTLERAASCGFVRVLKQRGRGFADAWNHGVEAARGAYVAFLDSDDTWAPGKLAAQVGLLDGDPGVSYVLGRVRFVLEPGFDVPPGFRPELLEAPRVAPMPGTLLARRSVFDEVGPFGTGWSIASDIDWFARLKDSGLRHATVDDVVTFKRVHDGNLSHVAAGALNSELLLLLRSSLERRRATA